MATLSPGNTNPRSGICSLEGTVLAGIISQYFQTNEPTAKVFSLYFGSRLGDFPRCCARAAPTVIKSAVNSLAAAAGARSETAQLCTLGTGSARGSASSGGTASCVNIAIAVPAMALFCAPPRSQLGY